MLETIQFDHETCSKGPLLHYKYVNTLLYEISG